MDCVMKFLVGQPSEFIDLFGIGDSAGVCVNIYANRISIKFPDEEEWQWFYYDYQSLYEKIDCKCKKICFNFTAVRKRALRFELEDLSGGQGVWTVRMVIIGSKTDNYLVELVRSELLGALAYFCK
ncbi:hypothetical protein A2572_02425 [Candidatus Collierbacteria bacterium RIFOXYD1_FULL_40_9]|uniref:Uncharacterized protein n=1 Tax=Candidatus Collierbacteria bacterium RIFOXYD1_FULL_40_9 TaxID=1817731 RepID=A0A1F5FPH8_9BACT|nr:MAG: hypothetical protein A2572_02425 [Candidatus Collierbacteria bacterium RIFOXYD1_FULL_40_9]